MIQKAEIWPSYAQLYYLKSGHGIFWYLMYFLKFRQIGRKFDQFFKILTKLCICIEIKLSIISFIMIKRNFHKQVQNCKERYTTGMWWNVILIYKRKFVKPALKFSNLPIRGMIEGFIPNYTTFSAIYIRFP